MAKKNEQGKSGSGPTKAGHKGEHTLFFGSKKALAGGIIAGSIALFGQWMVGQVYGGWEARQLLETANASAHYFGSSIVTGAATILALMLTMLGLTKQSESEFDVVFFKRIELIGFLSTVAMIAGVILLLFLSVPVQESDEVPGDWYRFIYYFLIIYIALLAGLTVSVVLMLYNSIKSLIHIIRPSIEQEQEDVQEREEEESEAKRKEVDES